MGERLERIEVVLLVLHPVGIHLPEHPLRRHLEEAGASPSLTHPNTAPVQAQLRQRSGRSPLRRSCWGAQGQEGQSKDERGGGPGARGWRRPDSQTSSSQADGASHSRGCLLRPRHRYAFKPKTQDIPKDKEETPSEKVNQASEPDSDITRIRRTWTSLKI